MAKLVRVLSIDGGGIKGILPGKILVHLENKLKELSGNPDARIADYFDLVAGTSTGGILTCLLLTPSAEDPGTPQFTAEEAVGLYLEKGSDIFHLPFMHKMKSGAGLFDEKYPARALETNLSNYLANTRLKDLLKPCIITAYDIQNRKAHFFTQHDALLKEEKDFYVRDVARATSAAPTYFEACRVSSFAGTKYALIDGGVYANNPTLCAYAEARKLIFDEARKKPRAADMAILSLGCGEDKKAYPYSRAKDWGKIGWIKPVIDIMMSGVSETVDYQLKQIFDAVEKPGQYLRIQPSMGDAGTEMDNAGPGNLKELEKAGEQAAKQYDSQLTEFARHLV